MFHSHLDEDLFWLPWQPELSTALFALQLQRTWADFSVVDQRVFTRAFHDHVNVSCIGKAYRVETRYLCTKSYDVISHDSLSRDNDRSNRTVIPLCKRNFTNHFCSVLLCLGYYIGLFTGKKLKQTEGYYIS